MDKTRTVLVKCLVVDSDGYAVDGHGKMLRAGQRGFYEWEKRSKSSAWLADPANRKLWLPPQEKSVQRSPSICTIREAPMTDLEKKTEAEYALEAVLSFIDNCIELTKRYDRPEGEMAFRKIRRRLDD